MKTISNLYQRPEGWECPPAEFNMSKNEIHIWKIQLDFLPQQLKRSDHILSFQEREKAGRFFFETDKRRYLIGHSVLRTVLGKYTDTAPDQIQFKLNPQGRPCLQKRDNSKYLDFNLSYSHSTALCAIAFKRQVGVDVESVNSSLNVRSLAKQFFSDHEYKMINALPENKRPSVFLCLWTLKEACLKASGKGLGCLEEAELPISSDVFLTQTVNQIKTGDSGRWAIFTFMPAPGCIAGLAIEGEVDFNLRFYSFRNSNGQIH